MLQRVETLHDVGLPCVGCFTFYLHRLLCGLAWQAALVILVGHRTKMP